MMTENREEETQTAPFPHPRSSSPHNVNAPTFSGGHRTVQLTLTNHSPVPDKSPSGFCEGEGGSTARELLKNVKDEDDQDLDPRKKSWLFGRKSPTPFQQVPDGRGRYARMGILMANSPDVRTSPFLGKGAETPRNLSLPPASLWSAQVTSQRQQHSVPTRSSTRPTSYIDGFSNRRLEAKQITRPKSDSFDLLDDVDPPKTGIGNGSPQNELSVLPVRGTTAAQQPSPPINLRSETKQEPTSIGSPDSGYGNTPDNNTGATNTSEAEGNSLRQAQKVLRTRKTHSEVEEAHTPDTLQISSPSKCENLSSIERPFGSSQPGTRESVPQFSSSCVAEKLLQTNLQNVKAERGNSETATDVGSIPSLPADQQVSDASGGTGDPGPFPHQPFLKSTQSVQEPLIGVGDGGSSPYASIHKHFLSTHAAPQPPMHIQYGLPSADSGSDNSSPSTTRRLSMSTRLAAEVTDDDFSNLDIAPFRGRTFQVDPDHPTRFIAHHSVGGVQSGGNGSALRQHSATVQGRNSHSTHAAISAQQRRRSRAHSQPMAKSLEVHQSMVEGKDYFTVTDELSKENTHFALSEALLVIIEQYKSNCLEQRSDVGNTSVVGEGVDGEEVDGGTSQPLSPLPPYTGMSPPTGNGSPSSWGSVGSGLSPMEDSPQHHPAPATPRISLLELMQSEAGDNSAESTAQHLLQHVAGQLTGSMSGEFNLSQTVLQLPTDFLTSLQMDEDLQKSVTTSKEHMRGNKDWAPPRRQIIFHVKTPSKNLGKDLSAQGYRCTGCGMKVAPSHARYFRFCNYTGKYFCQNCHTNAGSVIPAQIIDKWSFKKYPVSNFARDLLTKIQHDPVFNVQTVNRHIYSRVPSMAQALDLRTQLVSVRQYIKLCRKARNLHLTFEGYSPWTTDLHLYSMEDFYEVKNGVKVKHLRALLADAVQHIKTCPICQGKGFVCEFCKDPGDVIYPFEIHKVSACKVCQCCFHKECFRGESCPRCIRVQERHRQRVSRLEFRAEGGEGSHEQPS